MKTQLLIASFFLFGVWFTLILENNSTTAIVANNNDGTCEIQRQDLLYCNLPTPTVYPSDITIGKADAMRLSTNVDPSLIGWFDLSTGMTLTHDASTTRVDS
jgi:hypothetical protein